MGGLILAIIVLGIGFALMKKWFPSMYGLTKRLGFWTAKGMAARLWRRPEKKGGASVRPARMRWRD
jgi:hypothetical protein